MNGCHSGHLRLRSERNLAYPAGAQEGRHQGFHPLVNHPFPKRVWRKPESGDRCEIEERQLGYRCVPFVKNLQFTDSVLLHISATLRWVRHDSAAQFAYALLRTAPANFI